MAEEKIQIISQDHVQIGDHTLATITLYTPPTGTVYGYNVKDRMYGDYERCVTIRPRASVEGVDFVDNAIVSIAFSSTLPPGKKISQGERSEIGMERSRFIGTIEKFDPSFNEPSRNDLNLSPPPSLETVFGNGTSRSVNDANALLPELRKTLRAAGYVVTEDPEIMKWTMQLKEKRDLTRFLPELLNVFGVKNLESLPADRQKELLRVMGEIANSHSMYQG